MQYQPGHAMNHAAWSALQAAESDPASYQPLEQLFTPEGLLYGVLVHSRDRRCGTLVRDDLAGSRPARPARGAAPVPAPAGVAP
jgi:hypothetical protein